MTPCLRTPPLDLQLLVNNRYFSVRRILTRAVFLVLLIALSAPAARAATDPTWRDLPSGIDDDSLTLVRHAHEPRACDLGYDGKLTMNGQAQACVCDGQNKQWKTVGTGESCVW